MAIAMKESIEGGRCVGKAFTNGLMESSMRDSG